MYPEIIFSESIIIPTYIVFLSLLYCFLIFYSYQRALKMRRPVKTTMDFALIMMIAGFVGGRLLHVFFEAPSYYQENWLRIFYFWQGGFVFYGGFLTAFAACLVYFFLKPQPNSHQRISVGQWADFFAPVIALGYGLGRVSCFLAGCCYGKACDLPWAVVFPWDQNALSRHPVQLYMALWELVIFAGLLLVERKRQLSGRIFFTWVLFHALGRFAAEQFRDDFRGNFILSFSLSSWVSLFLFAGALLFLFFPRIWSPFWAHRQNIKRLKKGQ